jgi:cell division protein ZapA (FtsZ GTPase activity inhibitor)
MTVLKIIIDKIGYEIECGEGQEQFLREAEKLINIKLTENPHLKCLPHSKFLMTSLLLAADLDDQKHKNIEEASSLKKIEDELANLENIIEEKNGKKNTSR